MKKAVFLGILASSLTSLSLSYAATTNHDATLNGAQEVPPVTTRASGAATLSYDDVTKKLTGTVALMGLADGDVSLAHIHNGACGVNGGIEATLGGPASGSITIDQTLTGAQEAALQAGSLYVNIHTSTSPNGLLRGQIRPVGTANNCPPGVGTTPTDGGGKIAEAGTASSSSGGSSSGDDGGCNTSGSSGGGGIAATIALGLAIAASGRALRRRR